MPPQIRTDIVDVYIFRRWPDEALSRAEPHVEFLQLLRTRGPLKNTWQPVMGHVEASETAVQCALREVREELGLVAEPPGFVGMWALEQVHPFFLPELDAVVMSPRFAVEVSGSWRTMLNGEHRAHRWIPAHQAGRYFMWPGQLAATREITTSLLRPGSLAMEPMRIR
jgi:8-oxo-dGTP pyrophosphatase MutT (NUDIX family)